MQRAVKTIGVSRPKTSVFGRFPCCSSILRNGKIRTRLSRIKSKHTESERKRKKCLQKMGYGLCLFVQQSGIPLCIDNANNGYRFFHFIYAIKRKVIFYQ